jgi:hypothetical protein
MHSNGRLFKDPQLAGLLAGIGYFVPRVIYFARTLSLIWNIRISVFKTTVINISGDNNFNSVDYIKKNYFTKLDRILLYYHHYRHLLKNNPYECCDVATQ